MPRVSRDQADANRLRVAQTAARLYREGGFELTSVAEIMESAGMTVGAFHRQFGSKEALAVEACQHAFAELILCWQQQIHQGGGNHQTFSRLVDEYLSTKHRDESGDGCVASALASDIAHQPKRSRLRKIFTAGVRQSVETLDAVLPASLSPKKRRRRALAVYATLVGAMTIARATSEDPISEEILKSAAEVVKLFRDA
jgi:TetR/AcrR family transcriptional repressor of nem operon